MGQLPKVDLEVMEDSMCESNDAELLRNIVAKQDCDAFRVLYRRHEAAAFSLAFHVTGEKVLADEAVQDAMVRIWKYARTYDEQKGSVRSWLLRIVARQGLECIMIERKRRREQVEDDEVPRTRADLEAPTAEARIEQCELLNTLRQVLTHLPVADQRLVALYYGGGLSQREIAEAMAIPKRTVCYRLQKVLDQLRDDLTRAGLATAAPILAGGSLAEAVIGGVSPPISLEERVFEGVARMHLVQTSSEVSRRVVPYSWISAIPWIAAVCLVLGVGAFWYTQQSNFAGEFGTSSQASKEFPATAAFDLPAVRPGQEVPHLDRVWTFQEGPASDLVVRAGTWTWKRTTEPWGGYMELLRQDRVTVPLPLKTPVRPFLIRAEYTGILGPKGTYFMNYAGLYGKDETALNQDDYEGQLIYHVPQLEHDKWHVVHTFVSDRYVYIYVNRELTSVCTYRKPYPSDDLFVSFGGSVKVRRIELHTLREGELPLDLQDPEALKARLMKFIDAKQHPMIILPE